MLNFIFPLLLRGLEFYLKRVNATEEAWEAYKKFVHSSHYWSKLPSAKRMKVGNRWKRLEDRRKAILEQMKQEGKL